MAITQKYSSTSGASATATADVSQAAVLPESLASWMVPDSPGAPLPGWSSHRQGTLTQLARYFKLNPKAEDLEAEVVQALAKHYGVDIKPERGPATNQLPTNTEAAAENLQRAEEAFKGGTGSQKSVEEAQAALQRARSSDTGTQPAPGDETNTTALNQIAEKAGLTAKDHFLSDPLGAIALKLLDKSAGAGAQQGQTAAEVYSGIVKQLHNAKFKSEFTNWLAQGNFLTLSANQGTPDIATISRAYASLLAQAQQSGSTIQQAWDAGRSSSALPGGGQPSTPASETVAAIQGMGEKLGVHLLPQQITYISNQLEGDISASGSPLDAEDEIKNMVIQFFNPNDPQNPPGAASDIYQKVLSAAQQYGIPVAQADIMNWVVKGVKNTAGDSYSIAQAAEDVSAAAAKNYQQMAEGLYPSLASQIQSGQNVADLISPYNSITAAITGVDPATLNDPGAVAGGPTGKYYAFLQGARDPKTNNPSMMTMDQWSTELKQNPQYGFQNTLAGKDMSEQLSSAILNQLGLVNTMGGTSEPFNAYQPSSDLSANEGH